MKQDRQDHKVVMRLTQYKKESTESLRSPVWFREWFKIIMRQWASDLTMQQLAVVLFIFDRTAAWGKEWEYIRFASFVTGITSKDGSVRYSAGVCNSIATAMRIAKELVGMGYLRKERTMLGNRWSLNYEYKAEDNSMRKVIRQTKLASVQGSKVASVQVPKVASVQVSTITTNVEYRNAMQKTNISRDAADDGISIADALTKARAKAQMARDRQALRKQGRMNSVQVSIAWTAALQKAEWTNRSDIASGRMYLSKRDAGALKSYSDRFNKNYAGKSFREFLEWLIVNWQDIRQELFSWMTQSPAPESPAALFIIRWAEKLEARYMQGIAFENKLSSAPQTRLVKPSSKTTPVSIETKALPTRRKIKPLVSLPSLDETYLADEYED